MKIIISFLIFIILFFFFTGKIFSAEKKEQDVGFGGRDDLNYLNAKNSNFKKGKDALKQARKFFKKKKIKKGDKRLNDAIRYFVVANKEFPNNAKILNYLGIVYYEAGDLLMSEIYFQEGLEIDPKNNSINQGLGTLYFKTNRKDFAKERLNILRSCNCQEYLDLKSIIKSD